MSEKDERAAEAQEEISRQLETFVELTSSHPNESAPLTADPSQMERLLREFVDCLDGTGGLGTELDELDLVYRKARKFLEKKEGG
tara:strand:+ start:591 stop:845 length:255 start_codon:yes stop_codon:yes gene_type:complete